MTLPATRSVMDRRSLRSRMAALSAKEPKPKVTTQKSSLKPSRRNVRPQPNHDPSRRTAKIPASCLPGVCPRASTKSHHAAYKKMSHHSTRTSRIKKSSIRRAVRRRNDPAAKSSRETSLGGGGSGSIDTGRILSDGARDGCGQNSGPDEQSRVVYDCSVETWTMVLPVTRSATVRCWSLNTRSMRSMTMPSPRVKAQ